MFRDDHVRHSTSLRAKTSVNADGHVMWKVSVPDVGPEHLPGSEDVCSIRELGAANILGCLQSIHLLVNDFEGHLKLAGRNLAKALGASNEELQVLKGCPLIGRHKEHGGQAPTPTRHALERRKAQVRVHHDSISHELIGS